MRLHHRVDQRLDHQRIAADIPARLQPGPRMGLADQARRRDIVVAVARRENPVPVLLLQGLRARHMGVVAKERAGFRRRSDSGVELRERGTDRLAHQRLEPSQRRERLLVHAHEGEALRQGAVAAHRVRHSKPLPSSGSTPDWSRASSRRCAIATVPPLIATSRDRLEMSAPTMPRPPGKRDHRCRR